MFYVSNSLTSTSTTLNIFSCNFTNNSGAQGGILNNAATTINLAISLISSTFQNNWAFVAVNSKIEGNGGLIYLFFTSQSNNSVLMLDNLFVNNSGSYTDGYGGVLYIYTALSTGVINMTNNIFLNNSAYGGGVIYSYYGTSLISMGNNFTNNLAYDAGGAINVKHTTLVENNSLYFGSLLIMYS